MGEMSKSAKKRLARLRGMLNLPKDSTDSKVLFMALVALHQAKAVRAGCVLALPILLREQAASQQTGKPLGPEFSKAIADLLESATLRGWTS